MDWIDTYWHETFYKGSIVKEFVIDISKASYVNKNAKKCAVDLVKEIVAKYPPPYYLMVSGGVDSQALLQSWIEAEQPFIAYCAVFPNDLNYHDIKTLEQFKTVYNINVKYLPFDITDFLENQLVEYAIKYQCNSPHIMSQAKISEMFMDGTVISSGMPIFKHTTAIQQNFTYSTFGLQRYKELANRNFIPYFLCHTKEIVGAWQHSCKSLKRITSENIAKLNQIQYMNGTNDSNIENNSYSLKCEIYRDNEFKIIPQESKLHGFEKLKELYDSKKHLISDAMKRYPGKDYYRVFDVLFRYPLEQQIPYTNASRLKVD